MIYIKLSLENNIIYYIDIMEVNIPTGIPLVYELD